MRLSPSAEGLAIAIAVVLVLFTPMLDPLLTIGLAIAALVGLIAVAYVGMHRPGAPHH